MKIIKQSIKEVIAPGNMLQHIEDVARVCYQSEGCKTATSAAPMVRRLVSSGHTAMLEHVQITVKLITSRDITHELVRHRHCAFAQESTRYCGAGDFQVIEPYWFSNSTKVDKWSKEAEAAWIQAMVDAETAYYNLGKLGLSRQGAKSVLPGALKAELVITTNPAQWAHIFRLRCSKKAHPDVQHLMTLVRRDFQKLWPALFGPIEED